MTHGAGEAFAHERPVIAERIARHPLAHWVPAPRGAEIPFAPVLTVQEAMESASTPR